MLGIPLQISNRRSVFCHWSVAFCSTLEIRKNVQLVVLQHFCKTSLIAMLRKLQPKSNLSCNKSRLLKDLKVSGKTRNIAIQLALCFVARQVERFLLPFFPYLKALFTRLYEIGFLAGTKAIRHSMNTYPICDSPL